jgi:iron complex transport system substrate-binding protein
VADGQPTDNAKRRKFMKKNWLVFVISIVMVIGVLAGCTAPTATPTTDPTTAPIATEVPTVEPTVVPIQEPVIVLDALGRAVGVAELPQRIVLAGKATTMLIDAFYMFPEALDKVVSYENRSQNANDFIKTAFPVTESLTLIEKNAAAEQIAPLNPDLVVMKTYMKESLGDSLEAIGIPVIYLDLETPDKFYADLRTIGQVLGNSDRAEELVSLYQASDESVKKGVSTIAVAEKPTVLLLQYSKDGDNIAFEVPPAEWLQTIIVENAGGNPVWKETTTDGGWTVVTLEQIAVWNPDIIFIVDYSGGAAEVVKSLKADSNWTSLDAIKNNQIYAFPADYFSWDQPDPRWILGELWLATKIHPTQFTSVNINEEFTNFYKSYYGLDVTTITEKILPLLTGDL